MFLELARLETQASFVSQSQLIETVLRQMSSVQQRRFSERWRGKFEPGEGKDPRHEALAKKYL